jgi:hypothetical protein
LQGNASAACSAGEFGDFVRVSLSEARQICVASHLCLWLPSSTLQMTPKGEANQYFQISIRKWLKIGYFSAKTDVG